MDSTDVKIIQEEYRGIALEGGGVAGIAHAGVCKYLEKINLFDRLTHFAGSSAGSIAAGLLACRLNASQIHEILSNTNFKEFKDDSWFVVRDIYRLINQFGWNRGDAIEKWYSDILEKYIGNRNITFKEIYEKYKSYLIITSTDVGYDQTIYYTPDSVPDMPICKAVRESISIPIFFCPVSKDGNLYVDGGTKDNYPIQKLYEYLPKEQVFGVKLMSSLEIARKRRPTKIVPNNLLDFTSCLIDMLYDQALRIHIRKDDWSRSIIVDIMEISSRNFNLTDKEKQFLLDQGYNAAEKFFSE